MKDKGDVLADRCVHIGIGGDDFLDIVFPGCDIVKGKLHVFGIR